MLANMFTARTNHNRFRFEFCSILILGEPLQVTVRPMLWDRCPVCL